MLKSGYGKGKKVFPFFAPVLAFGGGYDLAPRAADGVAARAAAAGGRTAAGTDADAAVAAFKDVSLATVADESLEGSASATSILPNNPCNWALSACSSAERANACALDVSSSFIIVSFCTSRSPMHFSKFADTLQASSKRCTMRLAAVPTLTATELRNFAEERLLAAEADTRVATPNMHHNPTVGGGPAAAAPAWPAVSTREELPVERDAEAVDGAAKNACAVAQRPKAKSM